ncbi:dihydroxyacetone kinase [Moniliophthora roreri]|nr:dihydroxyacetone kinase [Moniliophthora roreri]
MNSLNADIPLTQLPFGLGHDSSQLELAHTSEVIDQQYDLVLSRAFERNKRSFRIGS